MILQWTCFSTANPLQDFLALFMNIIHRDFKGIVLRIPAITYYSLIVAVFVNGIV